MKALKFAKPKKVKKSTMKKKAWDMFSKYIRVEYSDGNLLKCYTCPHIGEIKTMQAGHGIPGRNNAVLFMEKLVKPQDIQCNIFKHGNLAVFTRKLIAELGVEEYDRLAREARQIVQLKSSDYQAIYDNYKGKLAELGFKL